ncbi:MAG: MFS transporter [Ktedonobacteraceae bacterium]|nr:MFS transporter [Ktedonobacteraceae bacterium]
MSTLQNDNLETTRQPVRPLPLWRNRNFLLLISGQGVSAIGTQVSQFAFPLLILALTHSPAQTGLITALRGLPYALFSLPAGALVDRWNRKLVMIVCDTGRAIALASIPIAFAFGIVNMVQLYAVSLIEGTLFVFFHMAEATTLPHVVTPEQLPAAAGQNEVLNSSSILIGPSIGGILYTFSSLLPFLADAISYTFSIISLLFIRVPFQKERVDQQQNLWIEVRDGLSWLWHHRLIRFTALVTGGLVISSIGYTLIVIIIAQSQHASSFTIGLLFASGGAGSVIGAFLVAPLMKRFGFAYVMIASTWIWALSWLLFAFAFNPLLLGIANGLSYTIVPIFLVSQFSYRLALIPDALQGRVNSVFRLIAFGGQPIGLVLTGLLLQAIGPLATILVLFVPQLGLAILVTVNKDVRAAAKH